LKQNHFFLVGLLLLGINTAVIKAITKNILLIFGKGQKKGRLIA
jgi:hypothetical protein